MKKENIILNIYNDQIPLLILIIENLNHYNVIIPKIQINSENNINNTSMNSLDEKKGFLQFRKFKFYFFFID